MNSLGLYIKEVLEEGKSVHLPGIGTFKKERIPAFFDALKDCFVPPLQHLILMDEASATHSDFMFAEGIGSRKVEEKQQLIEQEIRDMKEELRKGDEIFLEGLGRLKQNGDRIEFNFTGSLDSPFVDYDEAAEIEVLENVEVPALNEVENTEIAVPIMELDQQRSSRSWLWAIVVLIAAGAAFAWFWYSNPAVLQPGERPSTADNSGNEPAATGPAPTTSLPEAFAETRDTPTIEIEEPVPSLIREPSGRFEIIIAAFETLDEATVFAQRTNAKGYEVYIIKNQRPSNLNKVSYASFETESEVNEAIAKVRKELNPDAWIYKNKNHN